MLTRIAIAFACSPAILVSQTPTSSVFGTVYDPSGAVVPKCVIAITNQATAASREVTASPDGTYFVGTLTAGEYQIRAEANGFRPLVRPATLSAGQNTLADLHLQLPQSTEQVNVVAANAQIHFDTAAVDGMVSRLQMDSLPLNGRNFLQLATLVPGVSVTPGYPGLFNRQFDVSILGGDKLNTIISVDGGSVWDQTTGGTGTNFSQEVVQEFQVASANFDISTGITGYGAINVATRSGGNDLHGAAYLYYRDHNMAAYPGLARDAVAPNPYFARKQPGFWVGGPIRKNRLFYFFNLEDNFQDSVFVVAPDSPLLSGLAEVAPSPFRGHQLSSRFDYLLSPGNFLMVRYSHDGNRTTAPPSAPIVSPSNWMQNRNWSDQSLLALSSVIHPSLVNDFRFSFWYWSNRNIPIARDECTAACFGYGLPEIQILGTNFTVGATESAPQGRDSRRWSYSDSLTWEKLRHRIRVGGEMAHENIGGYWDLADPGVVTVYSPDLLSSLGELGTYGLSGGLHSTADILKLPLYSFFTGVGDPSQPQPYNRDQARQNNRFRIFAGDTWRVHPRVTVNYGLAWSYEDNLLNFDLPKPAFLEPIFGAHGLRGGDRNLRNFSPSVGVAWRIGRDNRTVVRAGAGIYYDTQLLWERGEERSYLGPFPNGRVIVDGGSLMNPVPGIPGAPVGQPINYPNAPTGFTAGLLVQLLSPIRSALSQAFGTSGKDLSLPTIDISKSAADLLPERFPTAYSEQVTAGIQREISRGFVVSSDFVFRQYMHTLFDAVNTPDYNHFNAASGPVIPRCVGLQGTDPTAECSTGPITVWTPGGRGNYKGLLAKVDKNAGGRFQFGIAYALASQTGFDAGNGFANLNNWFANYGPIGPRHSLTISGLWTLPWKLQLSFISTVTSRPPVMPYIDQIDLSGSGSAYSLLPGVAFNCFNRGCGGSDLRRAVQQFNGAYAGKLTSRGQIIPAIALPSSFRLGEGVSSQDVRVGKTVTLSERANLRLFVESFNLLNVANRSGYNFNLNSPGFGQPTQRVGQTFGSGGPRAFQLGARVSF